MGLKYEHLLRGCSPKSILDYENVKFLTKFSRGFPKKNVVNKLGYKNFTKMYLYDVSMPEQKNSLS